MAKLKMKVYDAAYELTGVDYWASEEEYRHAEEFLMKIGASRVPPSDAVDKNADFYLQTREQLIAFGSYRHRVIGSRPRTDPPSLEMEIYFDGAHGRISWANEEEYQEAKKLLADMGVPADYVLGARYESPEYFYLESEQQYQALFALRKSLEEKRKA